jgi:hypothetical protein
MAVKSTVVTVVCWGVVVFGVARAKVRQLLDEFDHERRLTETPPARPAVRDRRPLCEQPMVVRQRAAWTDRIVEAVDWEDPADAAEFEQALHRVREIGWLEDWFSGRTVPHPFERGLR